MSTLWSQDLFIKAWEYASIAHQGQTYSTPVAEIRLQILSKRS